MTVRAGGHPADVRSFTPPRGGPPLLAEAKLAPPRPRPQALARPRPLATLDAGGGSALTLVAAPAGYGKTSAVRAWCATLPGPVAWVTADEGDNDPFRFWRYIATAVDRVRDGLGRQAIHQLAFAGEPLERAIDELMRGLASLRDEIVVVVDDLNAVTSPECLASLDYALDQLPPRARMVAVTRRDPPLRLAQRRARGTLTELRADELAFSPAEARELLVERAELPLADDEVEALRARTEGWPAALVLASHWLRHVDDPGRAVREFGGQHRFVAEYLSREVLDVVDSDVRDFLLQAAVLGEFTPQLCDAVMGRGDSETLLADLEQANLFLVRLERGDWFRLHSLFAEFARVQLASAQPDGANDIHRRAARWLVAEGLPVEAIEHAAAAGDHAVVADLLYEHRYLLIRNGGAPTLLRWTGTLPDACLVERPALAAAAATAAAMGGGRTIEQRRLLQLADRGARQGGADSPYAEATAAMVRAATVDRGVARAVREGRRAVDLALQSEDGVTVAAHAAHARALYFAGRPAASRAAALAAIEHPDAERRPPGHALARATLALIAADAGQLASARQHAEKAHALVARVGSMRTWIGANASVALGAVLLAEGRLAEAERELAHAEHYFRDEVATVHHAWLLLVLARVRSRRGRLEEATAALRTATAALDELDDAGSVGPLASAVAGELEQARARVNAGEVLDLPSAAELSVLLLLGSDLSTRDIGAQLFLSPNTVRSHTRAIYRKLQVSSRADAVARAGELGLLEPAGPIA
jgi:LuxR family transcriptional regulator, maltose regulon positive regulatory protein